MMVEFTCPHCGSLLAADSSQTGMTLACPYCNGLVTLQAMTPQEVAKQAAGGVLVGLGAALLAAWFDN